MVNELTAQQTEVVSEALSRLEKLIHFADAEMKAATLEYINCQLLHSEPRSNGTFLSQSICSLKGSIAAKILKDSLPALFHLGGIKPSSLEQSKGLFQKWASRDLTQEQRWEKSVEALRAVVASLEEIAEQTKKHSLRDDVNILALAAAKQTGKDFKSAAAFCREFLKDRPNCGATQKSLETMLGRECSIWKKQKTKP